MVPFSNEASLIYVDNNLNDDCQNNSGRTDRIVRVIWRLWYKHNMNISPSAFFQIQGRSYLNLAENINKETT